MSFPSPRPGGQKPFGTPSAATRAPIVFTVELTRTFGRQTSLVTALDRVTVAFEAERFTSIMGPSGSGKSTLLHCLAGLERPTSGSVVIGDTDLAHLSDTQLTTLRRDRLGFVFQAFNLLPALTAEENITLSERIGGPRIDRQWLAHLMQVLGLGDRLDHRPSGLSGGQQQRMAIARALAHRPTVVFADEPTSVGDAKGLLQAVRSHDPNLSIVDVRMPPTHTDEGMRAARTLRHENPSTRILVLSQIVSGRAAADLLASGDGGIGYLLKDRVGNVNDFLHALETIAAEGEVIDPQVIRKLLRHRSRIDDLTARETEVLALMAEGSSNAAIAEELVVSDAAIAKCINRIYAKLDLGIDDSVHKRVQAVLAYLQR